ncbi:MAG TPA: transketolase C-terminal domain-containing protein [Thermoguttaceae bacterium]|nr:transketolase C-terminal domain-containing protein [Thermoguttaceae bacterium]
MRTAFIQSLTELAAQDPRITLVVGDLGFGVVTDFAKRFPKQYLNAGVAEQNMTGLAAGMAMAGRIVFTYSIANFPTLRCLEQLRNDVCYHNANVVVVAVGGGFSYGALGMSHHACEDIAILRSLPRMTVVAPGDPVEAKEATRAAAAGIGPVYLRLGRAGEPLVHEKPIAWTLGKALTVRQGDDATLISTGAMLHTAVRAADVLAADGLSVGVLSMHTVKPLDEEAILETARRTRCVVTLEEHSLLGGLGSAVAEVLCEAGIRDVAFKRIGLPSEFSKHVGEQEYLRKIHGLDVDSVVRCVRRLGKKDPPLLQYGGEDRPIIDRKTPTAKIA